MDIKTNKISLKREVFNMPSGNNYAILWLMLCIYPFIVVPNPNGYFYMPRYIILAILAVFAVPLLLRGENLKPFQKLFVPLSFFFIFGLISTLKSIDIETAWMGLFGIKAIPIGAQKSAFTIIGTSRFTGFSTYIFCIIMFFLAYQSDKSENLIKCMIISGAIVSIIAILQHFGLNIVPHESYRDGYPPYGTIGQHNFLATYCVFILPAAMFYYLKYKNKLYILCTGLIYGGLLVSRTRGAWMAFGITYMIYLLYIIKKKDLKKGFAVITLAFVLVSCILLPSRGGVLLGRVASIPSNISSGLQLEDSAGSARMYIWKRVIRLFPKYWAFGMGPDNLIYAGIMLGQDVVDKAHNIYLEMAVTMGVFTLSSYLIFISYFLRPWKNDTGFMYFIMILTYMMQGFFNIDVIMVMPIFWIVLGFSLSNSTRIAERSNAA